MKNSLILLVALLVCSASFAQVDPLGDFNKYVAANWKADYLRIGQYKVKGSPYLLGEPFPGVVTYKGGKTITDKKILYDVYNQKAGIEVNGEVFETDAPIESFTMNLPEKFSGKKLLFKNTAEFGKPEMKGYFNVVEDGKKLALLKVYKSKLAADPVDMMSKELKIFEQYFDYYIYNKQTKSLSSIKLRKKDLSKEIDEAFVKNFLSTNTGDVSSEFTVIQMINQYNAL